ncbi:DUF805 domain-containing protein [Mycobacteroides chelonae]
MTYGQPQYGGHGEPERSEGGQPNFGSGQPQGGPVFGEQPYPPAYPAGSGYAGGFGPPPNPGAQNPRDLTLPLYGATFRQLVTRFFGNYATFSGRASKSEYWWPVLAAFLVFAVSIVLLAIVSAVDIDAVTVIVGIVLVLFALALILPSVSVSIRRLHDANLSGWLYLLSFVPVVNYFTAIVFGLLNTDPAGARYDRR